jgi:hypothetical protein
MNEFTLNHKLNILKYIYIISESLRISSIKIRLSSFVFLFVVFFNLGCASVGIPETELKPLTEPNVKVASKIEFDVKNPWNDQGIMIVAGHSYQFNVSTPSPSWCDGENDTKAIHSKCSGIPSSLDKGWLETDTILSTILKELSFLRRCPQQPWYALTGVIHEINQEGIINHCFLIGSGNKEFEAKSTGRLFVFANDSFNKTYKNNSGGVTLTIIRIK